MRDYEPADAAWGRCIDCDDPLTFREYQTVPLRGRCFDCHESWESEAPGDKAPIAPPFFRACDMRQLARLSDGGAL